MALYGSKSISLYRIIFGILCTLTELLHAYQVVLLDTTQLSSLNWETYTPIIQERRRGWREGSYNNADDVNRVYTVCNVAKTGVHNWLRTPYIPRGNANRLYIEMKFTMRKCTKYPDPTILQQCMESFKLLYFEAEDDFANSQMPTWDTQTYTHVDVIAADNTFEEIGQAKVNTETRSIPITRRGVYFTFYDTGACTTLLALKIYYIMCNQQTINYAVFPNTTTGPEASSIVQTDGMCVSHAAIEEPPTYLCKGDGTWIFPNGGCKCMPGYEPAGRAVDKCRACKEGFYKWNTGSHSCQPCPDNSKADKKASVGCECVPSYYRNPRDGKSMSCTRPPTSVRNLKWTFKDHTSLTLTWSPPEEPGGRRDLGYEVICEGLCSHVHYEPAQRGFNKTRVHLTGLKPSSNYTIRVYAYNGVSQEAPSTDRHQNVFVTTDAAYPAKVQNLRLVSVNVNGITIAWDKPRDLHTLIETYEILFHPIGDEENRMRNHTTKHNFTFTNLQQDVKYIFLVRGKTQKGWGEYSNSIEALGGTHHKRAPVDPPLGIIVGSAIAVVMCMLIVIIMVIIFLRRNQRHCNEKNVSDCDTLQYSHVPPQLQMDPTMVYNGGITIPLFNPPGGVKTYVDPHTYEDPNQAVREFTKEIDNSQIMIETVIGGGEFGDVCKGKLRVIGRGELPVAIKTLKPGATDKSRLDFLTEASIMGQFEDPNVIYLEGVVTKSNPIMIVTEYMANGSLDTFLRNNDGKFTVIQLVGMMRGIASGMRYLQKMGYVHRDLAARNILVNENLVCKVADFGLSREIESDDTEGAYTTKGGKIPVRWTAPEAISYRKFTSASDAWSYGVVMWEVMAYGERPYWNWSNQDVIKAVEKGYRLPPPMDCPEATHQLMLDCWQKERSHRPKFAAIVKTLDKLIRAPELLRKVAKMRPHNLLDPSAPDLTSFTSIEDWLTSIKMERYRDCFLNAGFATMGQVAALSRKDLVNMGITLVGHQKKIMNSVQTLRAQIDGTHVSNALFV